MRDAAARESTCCFTGHRPTKLPWGLRERDAGCLALKERIGAELDALYERGFRHFITGMAQGCDLYFAEEVLRLKERRSDVLLEAAVPCITQADAWSRSERERYHGILEQCDMETLVQHRYTRDCMLRRNRYMVDRSRLLLAAYDGKGGGTLYTLNYALAQGLETIVLPIE